jgi:1-deoxy-D-xylulose-5-phosphate reductoisomerase
MAKKITVLGSTGSVGIQTLEVARNLKLEVAGLTAASNIDLLEKQAREFRPSAVALKNIRLAEELVKRLSDTDIEVYGGVEGINRVAAIQEADTVVSAIVGSAGLIPTLEAIRQGKTIALSNKETLVMAGEIVISEAAKRCVEIIPVDSEHAAIFQCLMGNNREHLSKIILTASGGPFKGKSLDELKHVTPEEALKHPNWKMGSKITVDSSTMMNKGLEVIEAKWLFGLKPEQIEVLIHPQSIIHSMVEYIDGSIIAQLGPVDMKLPIQFALTYPKRAENKYPRLNFLEVGKLTFEKPDYTSFPCLRLAFEAVKAGGTMPAVLNAANEVAVNLFLKKEIGFLDIARIIENIMERHTVNIRPSLKDILEVDTWVRKTVESGNVLKAKPIIVHN